MKLFHLQKKKLRPTMDLFGKRAAVAGAILRDFVINYISEFGKPPTYQIIAHEFGIARNTAFYRMKYFRDPMK